MRRLMRLLASWWRRVAVRQRARLHGLMGLSDRALADIGLRRADVHGALMGVMPLGRHATELAAKACTCRAPAPLRRYQVCRGVCSKA
jgi:uncharacterized protein YjiS (DUF1127 family)